MVPAPEHSAVVIVVVIVMKTIVVVVVERTPGVPVGGVIAPVPCGAPWDVAREVDISYYRPVGNQMDGYPASSCVARVVCSGVIVVIIGFDYIILSVKCFVAYKLDVYCTIGEPLNGKHRNILCLTIIECYTKDNVMNIPVDIVLDCYIVDIIITVQIEVIDPRIRIVKVSFEFLEGLRFLEEIHYCVKIEVVPGQPKVIVRVIAGGQGGSHCHHYCKDRGYYMLFHDLECY